VPVLVGRGTFVLALRHNVICAENRVDTSRKRAIASDELWSGDQDRLRVRFAAIKHARALCRAVLGQDASRPFTFHD
jgi:hypothetical protein